MTAAKAIDLESEPWDYVGFAAMYARLVDYGCCFLSRSNGRNQQIIRWESDVVPERREWSQPEIEAASRLHSRIIRLPLRQNLVTQIFFNERCASFWPEIHPDKQKQIIRDLTLWPSGPPGVNARISKANRDQQWSVAPMHPAEFLPVRDRAIRMLCNGERMLPK